MSLIVCNISSVCFVVPFANGEEIDVWIQGELIAGGLIFHDGSPYPTDVASVCPVVLGPDPTETRVRAKGSSTFVFWDRGQDVPSSYLCEYFRRFTL